MWLSYSYTEKKVETVMTPTKKLSKQLHIICINMYIFHMREYPKLYTYEHFNRVSSVTCVGGEDLKVLRNIEEGVSRTRGGVV